MNNKVIPTFGIICLFILLVLAPISFGVGVKTTENNLKSLVNGNTLFVGGTGPNNYTKIQDAIDNASDGDTVFVYDDSSPYFESIIINKKISLIGKDKNICNNVINL